MNEFTPRELARFAHEEEWRAREEFARHVEEEEARVEWARDELLIAELDVGAEGIYGSGLFDTTTYLAPGAQSALVDPSGGVPPLDTGSKTQIVFLPAPRVQQMPGQMGF